MKVSISGLKRLETPSCGKCDCREVGMWERREIRRNRRNATYTMEWAGRASTHQLYPNEQRRSGVRLDC